MTLGEAVKIVRETAGTSIAQHPDQNVKMAMGWALNAFALKAAEASGPRGLYEWPFDIRADESKYRLPYEIVVVKEVWNDSFTPPRGYSRIPYPAQSQIESVMFASHSASTGRYAWWQVNRDIHIKPTPSTAEPGKLRVAGYGRPPLPKQTDEEFPLALEAEPWFFVKSAMRLVPPVQGLEALASALQDVEEDLDSWLWNWSASVPPGPIEDGVS